MASLRSLLHRYASSSSSSSAAATRQAAREALKSRTPPPPFPVVPSCPSPSCECAEMPPDLDIERSKDLNGTMVGHAQHLILSSGQGDWTSKVEDEKGSSPWGDLYAGIKDMLSPRGGMLHDPYHNVLLSTSSFQPPADATKNKTARAILFPSFQQIEGIGTRTEDVEDFVRTFLVPDTQPRTPLNGQKDETAHNRGTGTTTTTTTTTTPTPTPTPSTQQSSRWTGLITPIPTPTILICSHNSRDSRCGVLGPLLHAEFSQYINRRHTLRNVSTDESLLGADAEEEKGKGKEEDQVRSYTSHPEFSPAAVESGGHDGSRSQQPVNVGMISHVGGHKWAGNVIIYIPPDYHCKPVERASHGSRPKDVSRVIERSASAQDVVDSFTEGLSPLAGKGIWYGRVEPKHVEGIVEQTIGHGQVIRDLFRGCVNQDGTVTRL